MLQVKEIFGPTIQGEGAQAGWPAIFIRFAGCNMWNGKPETRAKSQCPYCDTDFLGGNPMSVQDILQTVAHITPRDRKYLIVLTGGEPLLQPENELLELIQALHQLGHQTQLETNGTVAALRVVSAIHFITLSPKVPLNKIKISWAMVDTLKILHPHPTLDIFEFVDFCQKYEVFVPGNLYVQPIDEGSAAHSEANLKQCIRLVKELGYPWRLSLQTHKIINEP